MLFESDRTFRLWQFLVSHNQLLIRSPRSSVHCSNIDIVFWGVEYVEMPSHLKGVTMTANTTLEIEKAETLIGKSDETSSVFVIESESRKFLIIAGGFKVLRNNLDIFESSLELFAGSDPLKYLGEVLAHS